MFHFHKVAWVRYLREVNIVCKKPFSLLLQCIKLHEFFQSYDHKYTATFLWTTVYNYLQ